jgi:hypothetical protein
VTEKQQLHLVSHAPCPTHVLTSCTDHQRRCSLSVAVLDRAAYLAVQSFVSQALLLSRDQPVKSARLHSACAHHHAVKLIFWQEHITAICRHVLCNPSVSCVQRSQHIGSDAATYVMHATHSSAKASAAHTDTVQDARAFRQFWRSKPREEGQQCASDSLHIHRREVSESGPGSNLVFVRWL